MFQRTTAINKLLTLKKRIRVVQGGTWAGKTFGIDAILIDHSAKNPNENTTVVAQTIPAIKRGALKDFKEIMYETGRWIEDHYNGSDRQYTYSNKSTIEFNSFDSVGIALIEGGFISKLKARENTTYPIDVQNNAEVIWVKMDGIKLNCRLLWIVTGGLIQPFTVIDLPVTEYYDTEGVNTQLTPLSTNAIAFQSQFLQNNTGIGTVDVTIETKLNFNAIMFPGNTDDGFVKIIYRMTQITPLAFISDTVVYTSGALVAGSSTTINVDLSDVITLPPNRSLELHFYCDDGVGGGGGSNDYEINMLSSPGIVASFFNLVPVGYIPALRTKKVYDTLISEVSDGLTTAASTLLDTTYVDQVVTCGDALRLLDNSIMKISFLDFYNSINGVLSASLYYDMPNDTVYLEDKVFVFPSATLIADIGAVNNVSIKQLSTEMFSKLKMGFGSFTYDEVNGKDEFNQTTEYLLPITRTQQNKDLTSDIRADMYGIEYTRLNLTDKTSTDADSDNDNFFLHINSITSGNVPDGVPGAGEPYYELFRTPIDLNPGPDYWNIENIQYPDTAFNIFFSAKRALARWGNYISSLLFLQDANLIKFQVTTKDNIDGTKLKTSEGDPVVEIDESANQFVADYLPQLFYPILFEVNFADTTTLATLIGSDPHGFIQFQYKGNTFEGFIIKLTTKPKLQTQTATLLATTNNDLSKIVYP